MRKTDFKICMVLTNSLNYDTRVLNEADALGRYFDLTILVPKEEKLFVGLTNFQVKEVPYRRYKSFMFNMLSMIWSLTLATWRETPDIFHAHDFDGLWCAFGAALFKRKILIYDSHELWSDLPPFKVIRRWKWLLPTLEKSLVWRAKAGITVNQSIADILSRKFKRQFLVIRNVASLQSEQEIKKAQFKWGLIENKKFILHIGSTGEWRGMEQIIASAQYLTDDFRIVFLGANKSLAKYNQLIKQYQVQDKIIFLPSVPPDQLLSIARRAHLGLTLTQNASLDYYYSTPNKLFQYVAAEIPILGSDFPEFKRVILTEKIGEVVDPSDPQKIAQKISFMLQTRQQAFYRRHLKGLAQKKYNWSLESEKLVSAYKIWQFPQTRDFSLAKYAQLCQVLSEHYKVITFAESLEENQPEKSVILRHDVDRMPGNALKMAQLEAQMGLRASYYFRSSQLKTHLSIIKKIVDLGHEVGYHYECLDEAKGDTQKALEIFEKNLTAFRQITTINTIVMHGNPLTRFDNRYIWREADLQKFGIKGEAFLSLPPGTLYFSDTGRTWSNRYKIKDVPFKSHHEYLRFHLESTNDLINLVQDHKINRFCVVTHPERWSDNWPNWAIYLCLDKTVQIIKGLILKRQK